MITKNTAGIPASMTFSNESTMSFWVVSSSMKEGRDDRADDDEPDEEAVVVVGTAAPTALAGPKTTTMRSSGLRNDGEEDALVVLVASGDDNGGEKDSATRPPRTTDAATNTATRRTKGGDDDDVDDDVDDDFGMRRRPLLPGEDGGRVSPLMVFARGEGEFLLLLLFLSLLLVEDGRSEGQRAMRCRLGCVATKNLNLECGGVPATDMDCVCACDSCVCAVPELNFVRWRKSNVGRDSISGL